MSLLRNAVRGLRWTDPLIAALPVAGTAWMMWNLTGLEVGRFGPSTEFPEGYQLDHNGPGLYLLVLAPLAILWWRRNAIAATLAATAVYGLHDLLFGMATRCGPGLPTSFFFAFLIGLRHQGRTAWWGAGVVVLFQFTVLVRDDAAGLGVLPVIAAMALGLVAVGRVTASKVTLSRELRERNEELRRLRDTNAALEVSGDRARLSGELDDLLDQHLTRLERTATDAASATDADTRRALLATIESDSRDTLTRMREIVGTLRGADGPALSPAPSVDHLDALLARHGGGRVQVIGDPRRLPASVELSAYRIVEHLLSVLGAEGKAPVEVALTFNEADLEVRIAGTVDRQAAFRDAVLRAKERASLQQGTFNVRVSRGRARAVAQLPVHA